MNRNQKLLAFLVVISLTVLACTLTSTGGGNNSGDDDERNNVLFQDDFSRKNSGWDRAEYDFATTDYGDDVYRIEITSEDYFTWATPYKDFDDVVIEVETFKASGGDDNGFGIVCRHEDEENFYFLEISSDGYAWIGKYYDAEYEVIDGGEASNVNLGNETNSLRAECIDDELSLYVNGRLELQVVDSDFTDGDVGLIVETYTSTSTEILFDNFIVSRH
jgi:hypothetical protein